MTTARRQAQPSARRRRVPARPAVPVHALGHAAREQGGTVGGRLHLHPWEIDPEHPRLHSRGKRGVSSHYINLRAMEDKLRRLLSDFRFAPVSEGPEAARLPRPERTSQPNRTTGLERCPPASRHHHPGRLPVPAAVPALRPAPQARQRRRHHDPSCADAEADVDHDPAGDHLALYGPTQFLRQSIRYATRRGLGILGSKLPLPPSTPSRPSRSITASRSSPRPASTRRVPRAAAPPEHRPRDLDQREPEVQERAAELPRLAASTSTARCCRGIGAACPASGRSPTASARPAHGIHFMNEELWTTGRSCCRRRSRSSPTTRAGHHHQKDQDARRSSDGRGDRPSRAGLHGDAAERPPQATYFSFPTREDGLRLRQQGTTLL